MSPWKTCEDVGLPAFPIPSSIEGELVWELLVYGGFSCMENGLACKAWGCPAQQRQTDAINFAGLLGNDVNFSE